MENRNQRIIDNDKVIFADEDDEVIFANELITLKHSVKVAKMECRIYEVGISFMVVPIKKVRKLDGKMGLRLSSVF